MDIIPELELEQPIQSGERTPLPLLPELEMLSAEISDIKYEFSKFKGVQQYVTNLKTGEFILNGAGEKIPRKEFNITFSLRDHSISSGVSRKAWLRVGASLGAKSKLVKLLTMLSVDLPFDPTPKDIMNSLMGKKVRFQLVNKTTDGKTFQNINFDSIRPETDKKDPIKDIKWEP